MNKIQRMEALFAGRAPDRLPAGFWFHYPASLSMEERARAHVDLCRQADTDIIKVMDDNFGQFFTQGIRIQKPSDWRHIRLPGKDCAHYRHMTELIARVLELAGGEAMVFPTMWSPFKIASFTYTNNGSTDAAFMVHCAEDPASVLEGVNALSQTLEEWAADYLRLGSAGLYYSGQFSEPQRFSQAEWERLVKPWDLQVLAVTGEFSGRYNIVHICGEEEFGFTSSPRRYAGYPGHLFNWDIHRTDLSLEEGRELFQTPVLGGMDNHGALVNGTLEEIRAQARQVAAAMGPAGFMLGADCTVPGDIDIARLRAAALAVRE